MMSGELSADGLVARIDKIVGNVQLAFRQETGVHFDPQFGKDGVRDAIPNQIGKELHV